MDLNSNQNYQHQQHQSNSGLLRFRSAPSSLLANFTQGVESVESERRISRFANYSNSGDTASPCFQELEDKPGKAPGEAALNSMNSQQGYSGSGLPPYYPRHSSSATASRSMDSSYGLAGSMGMDHQTHAKSFGSHLQRQSSSPAGFFSNISFPNGMVLYLSISSSSFFRF